MARNARLPIIARQRSHLVVAGATGERSELPGRGSLWYDEPAPVPGDHGLRIVTGSHRPAGVRRGPWPASKEGLR
jgi:hypothetical protein